MGTTRGWAFSRTTQQTARWGSGPRGSSRDVSLVQLCICRGHECPHPAHSQGTTPGERVCSVSPGHASLWKKQRKIEASTCLRTGNWKPYEYSCNKLYVLHFRFPCAWLTPLPLRPYYGRIVHSALSRGPRASVNGGSSKIRFLLLELKPSESSLWF